MRLHAFVTVFLAIGVLSAWATASAQSGKADGQTTTAPKVSIGDRTAQLEDQLIDLQVQIATMRSLSATVAPAATGVAPTRGFQPDFVPPGNHRRVAALEGKVRTLASEIRQLSGRSASILPGATSALTPSADNRPPETVPAVQTPGWSGTTTVLPSGSRLDSNSNPRPAPLAPSVPATGQRGELLPGTVYGNRQPNGNAVAGWAKPNAPAVTAPIGDAETEYQTAYSYLLQQDYGAAQAAFGDFLARYPSTPLAGNAQYWIGETHYVSGEYKKAAVAFLAGYEKYGDGNKGPDSLLKLAMALGKLRQQAAACSSLRELGTRYRNASQGVLSRAKSEQQRLRCPN